MTERQLEEPQGAEQQALNSEEQEVWLRENVRDPAGFLAGITASRAELETYRAAGGKGFPPGWISRREYERQRALRSDL